MSFQAQSALGYSGSPVSFLNHDEVLWVCGNTVVLHSIKSGSQRLLRGNCFGIRSFATCPAHGLVAVVGKGHNPSISVYSARNLQLLGSVNLNYELGYSVVAFSQDGERLAVCGEEPNSTLVIVNWKTSEIVVEATVPKPIEAVSFHPYDSDVVATTGGGLQHVWKLEKLWDRSDFLPKAVELDGSYEPTAHAWFHKGLYVGTSTGEVLAIDLATLRPFGSPDVVLEPSSGATGEGAAASADVHPCAEQEPSAVLMVKALGSGAPVLSLSCNRDVLAVGGSDPTLVLLSHAHPAPKGKDPKSNPEVEAEYTPAPVSLPSFELRYEHSLGVAGVQALAFDSMGHDRLVVGTLDGMVSLIETKMSPFSGPGADGLISPKDACECHHLVDSHVGAVTGLCPHTCETNIISCGLDGSLRVWDMQTKQPITKRTFSSAQTAMAVCRAAPMAALGSETGVIRLVSLLMANQKPLQVMWRRRVHTSAVHSICFSPSGDWIASVAEDHSIWFTAITYNGSGVVLGHIPSPEPILAIVWPEVESEHSVLVSLASGVIMAITLAEHVAHGKTPVKNPHMRLAPKDFHVKVIRVECPMLRMTALVGERYGDLLALGADKQIHKISLPVDNTAWLGAKGRALRSAANMSVHRRNNGCLTLSNNSQLLLSSSADGHVATLTPGLLLINSSAPGGRAPVTMDADNPPGLHDTACGGATQASFDFTGRHFMTAGPDGSMFFYLTEGESHITTEGYKFKRPFTVPPKDFDAFDEALEVTEADHQQKAARAEGEAPMPLPTPTEQLPPPPPGKGGVTAKQHLTVLRDRLKRTIQANEEAPDLEKVDASAFIIFRDLLNELKAEADTRVASVYDAVKKEHLTLELITERVRDTCWEELAERGERITAMKSDLEVSNFPLREYSDKKLKHVTALRHVELLEARQLDAEAAEASREVAKLAENGGGSQTNVPISGTANASTTAAPAAPAATAQRPPDNKGAGAGAGSDSTPAAEDAAGEEVDSGATKSTQGNSTEAIQAIDRLLYPDMQLYGQMRKCSQIELLRRQVHNLKVQFNLEFKAVAKAKITEADKIMDLNQRIDETVHDLTKLSIPVQTDDRFEASFPEDMVHVLNVLDAEVQVDRSAADKLRKELMAKAAAAAHEAGGNKAAADDGDEKPKEGAGMGDRALRQMMGGTLEGKEEEDNEFTIVRPEWMDGNPKMFTEAQLKEFKEFQVKEKLLMEEKAKRVSSLESELRNLKGTVEDTANRFDEMLQNLQSKKMLAQAEVAYCESRIIDITANISMCAETGDSAERELYSRLTSSKEAANRVSTTLSEKRAVLADLEAKAAEVAAEEKLLDRNFKKEFIDTETFYPTLLQLYRLRTAVSPDDESPTTTQASQLALKSKLGRSDSTVSSTVQRHAESMALAAAAANSGISEGSIPHLSSKQETAMREVGATTLNPFPPLLPSITAPKPEEPKLLDESYRPEALDHEWWQRFVNYRAQKINAEATIKSLNSSLSLLHREIPRLTLEEARLTGEADAMMGGLKALRTARRMALFDGTLQLRLKAGQVEAEPPQTCSSDMTHAIFINRSLVEGLNSVVHAKGTRKVDILTAIKDFKKGIYQLEWEHKRGDMMISDLREKTRELQLLHVTREMQAVFKDGEDRSQTNDTANLEALAKQRERLHKKAMHERAKRMNKLSKMMEAKQTQNRDVSAHLMTLEKVLYEQERLRQSMQTVDEQVTRRMRSLVTHKRLKEIAEAQASEVAALAAELDKLRLRTYPTFVEPNHMDVSPDLNASCFTGSKRSVR